MSIIILGFTVRYRDGKREDWVQYAPRHDPDAITEDAVHRMCPPEEFKSDPKGTKRRHMTAVWSVLEPAYQSWLKGEEIPDDGMALQAWPGVNDAQVAELRKHSIRTVEDLAAITDAQIQKIQLPDVRGLRRQAQTYLGSQGAADMAKKLADQEAAMQAMQEQLEELRREKAEEKPKRGRPRKEATEAA